MTLAAKQSALAAINRRLLPFLFLLYVVAYLDRVNIAFAATGLQRDLGMNAAAYGFGAGIFFVGYVLFEVPSNLILERVGARRWISRILLTWGIVAALMAFVSTANQFFGLRLLLGIAEAGFFPGIVLFLSQWVPVSHRARMLAGFMLAIPMAGLLGGPISAGLLSLHGLLGMAGWRWLFLLEALPAVALSFVVWAHLPDRPSAAHWLQASEAAALEQSLDQDRRQLAAGGTQVNRLGAILWDRRLWLLCGLYMAVATGFYGFSFWIPRFVAEALPAADASPALANALSAIPYGVAVLAMLAVGRSSDRRQEQRLHVAVPLMVAAGALVMSIPANGVVKLVLISLACASTFSCLGPFWSMPPLFLGGRAAAGGIAWINAVGNIGGFLAPIGMGLLLVRPHGDLWAIAALAGVLLLGGLIALGPLGATNLVKSSLGDNPSQL